MKTTVFIINTDMTTFMVARIVKHIVAVLQL